MNKALGGGGLFEFEQGTGGGYLNLNKALGGGGGGAI